MITYLSYIRTWLRLLPPHMATDEANFVTANSPITIGVALHNEQLCARDLILSLAPLYSHKIIVLDHCTDLTEEVVTDAISTVHFTQQRLFTVLKNEGEQGKKHAQRLMVERSDTPYCLVTDADCLASPEWELTVIEYVLKNNPDLLLLPVGVVYTGYNLNRKLFAIDFLSLQMATIGCALANKPTMANGANLCFRRDLYLSHNANTNYASGDDMFLLAEAKQLKKNIPYLLSKNAIVRTTLPKSWMAFFRQHARWLRKGTGYKDRETIRLAWATFSATYLWPILLLALPTDFQWIALVVFSVKTIFEYQLLKRAEQLFDYRIPLFAILIYAVLYPLITTIIVITALFKGKKSW